MGIRVGRETWSEGKGYFEDRRPSSNCNPYVVTGKIMSTIMGPSAPEIPPNNREEAGSSSAPKPVSRRPAPKAKKGSTTPLQRANALKSKYAAPASDGASSSISHD